MNKQSIERLKLAQSNSDRVALRIESEEKALKQNDMSRNFNDLKNKRQMEEGRQYFLKLLSEEKKFQMMFLMEKMNFL